MYNLELNVEIGFDKNNLIFLLLFIYFDTSNAIICQGENIGKFITITRNMSIFKDTEMNWSNQVSYLRNEMFETYHVYA